jgi:hypothetical protein
MNVTKTTRRTSAPAKWDLVAQEVKLREARRAAALPAASSKAVKAATKAKDLTPQLEAAFERTGLSAEAARIAARGRGGRPAQAGTLGEAGRVLGLSPAAARTFARGRGIREAVTKNVAGLPASSFAWVPDAEDPTSWQMQISRSADSGSDWAPDEDLVRAAVAQLPGIAGYDKALDIAAADLPGVKATLRSAWIACGLAIDAMPAELNQEALRHAFLGLGLSESAAAVAASGRTRRAGR